MPKSDCRLPDHGWKWCIVTGRKNSLAVSRSDMDLSTAVVSFSLTLAEDGAAIISGDSAGVSPNTRVEIVDAVAGSFVIHFSAADSSLLTANTTYHFDIAVTYPGEDPIDFGVLIPVVAEIGRPIA